MKLIKQFRDGFGVLPLRQRVIAVIALASVFVLFGNLVLIKPQRLAMAALNQTISEDQAKIDEAVRMLADLDNDAAKGIDRFAKERATLTEYKRQIAEADSFFSDRNAAAEVDGLMRHMMENDQDLVLNSLKILPVTVFYAPQVPKKETIGDSAKQFLDKAKGNTVVKEIPLTDKTLYKHGLEIAVRGSYPSLMRYLDRIQNIRERIYWSEAVISTQRYPDAVLKLTINTISDQDFIPLK